MRDIRKYLYFGPLAESEEPLDDEYLDEALLRTNKALEKAPKKRRLWEQKGDILCDMERYDEASAAYDKSLELNPDHRESWLGKSYALLAIGHFEGSLQAADRAAECGIDDLDVLPIRAEALLELGRHGEAMDAVDRLLKEDPDDAEVMDLRADALSGMGRHSDAIEQLERHLKRDPWSVDTLVSLSSEHLLTKNFSAALEAAERAIGISENYPAALVNKAEALYGNGNPEDALECILKAQRIDPADDEVWYQKARILSQRNQEDALDSLLVAVSINPDNKRKAHAEESFAGFGQDERFKKIADTGRHS